MKRNIIRLFALLGGSSITGATMAHPGVHEAGGVVSSVAHSMSSFDHLLVILAVGFIAFIAQTCLSYYRKRTTNSDRSLSEQNITADKDRMNAS